MDSKATRDMALRLLHLEQRFEAYCALHREELADIEGILGQLRKDVLGASGALEAEPCEGWEAAPSIDAAHRKEPQGMP